MENKFDMLLDFWNWLGEQGLAYESLYYGDPEYVEDLIRTYLKNEKWVCRKESMISDATDIVIINNNGYCTNHYINKEEE